MDVELYTPTEIARIKVLLEQNITDDHELVIWDREEIESVNKEYPQYTSDKISLGVFIEEDIYHFFLTMAKPESFLLGGEGKVGDRLLISLPQELLNYKSPSKKRAVIFSEIEKFLNRNIKIGGKSL